MEKMSEEALDRPDIPTITARMELGREYQLSVQLQEVKGGTWRLNNEQDQRESGILGTYAIVKNELLPEGGYKTAATTYQVRTDGVVTILETRYRTDLNGISHLEDISSSLGPPESHHFFLKVDEPDGTVLRYADISLAPTPDLPAASSPVNTATQMPTPEPTITTTPHI